MSSRFAMVALAAAALSLAACGPNDSGSASAAPAGPVAAKAPPAGRTWPEIVSRTAEGFRMGNPDAPIKIVEYGSRTCPTCGAFGREGQQPLTERYVTTGKVSYEFRDYLVHGAPDFAPSLLGRCADPQAFFPLLEAMYLAQPQFEAKLADQASTAALQTSLQGKSPTDAAKAWGDYLGYVEFVKQHGMPEAKARACLSDAAALDAIVKSMSAGDGASVTGTPTFFLNGQKLDASAWPQVEAALKRAGA